MFNIKKNNFFHDGALIDIQVINNTIVLSLESSEVLPAENVDKIPLSQRNTLRGKLHIINVKQTKKNSYFVSNVRKDFDEAEIWDLDFFDDKVEFLFMKNNLQIC